MVGPSLSTVTTIAAAITLLLAAAVGVTSRTGARLVMIAIVISLIPEASASLSRLKCGEIERRWNERRRTGTVQPCAERSKVDR